MSDLVFSGFRSETCHTMRCENLEIPELRRSGQHLEIYYNLKAPERQQKIADPALRELSIKPFRFSQDWSIRQCSIHHKLDLETQQMTWIVIKANRVVQNALENQLSSQDPKLQTSGSLRRSCAVHRLITTWSGENWHWYISDMEKEMLQKTQRTLSIPLEPRSPGTPPHEPIFDRSPTNTKSNRTRTWSVQSVKQTIRRSTSWSMWRDGTASTLNFATSPRVQNEPLDNDKTPADVMDDFSFIDLQNIQFLEDKANEALLVLKANANVLRELKQEYAFFVDEDPPPTIAEGCQAETRTFLQHLVSSTQDIEMQQSRLDTLLKLLADRKSLVRAPNQVVDQY